MLAMLAATVSSNQGHAQFFFLVAAIAAGLGILFSIISRGHEDLGWWWNVILAVVILCLSIGLYFHA